MKKLLIVFTLLFGGLLQSCQCADKPDVGPVEDEGRVEVPAAVAR